MTKFLRSQRDIVTLASGIKIFHKNLTSCNGKLLTPQPSKKSRDSKNLQILHLNLIQNQQKKN